MPNSTVRGETWKKTKEHLEMEAAGWRFVTNADRYAAPGTIPRGRLETPRSDDEILARASQFHGRKGRYELKPWAFDRNGNDIMQHVSVWFKPEEENAR